MKIKRMQRPFEVKTVEENGTFKGYGSVFGNLDSYRDIVVKGAFEKSIADYRESGRHVKMLWQHKSDYPIGIYTDMKEDDHGLYVEGQINMDVQKGRECYSLLKQGALGGLSIGYNTVLEKFDKEALTTELLEVKLWEISPVTFPANTEARVDSVKSADEIKTYSDVEDFLRDRGLSQKEAETAVSLFKRIREGGPSDPGSHANGELKSLFENFSLT